MDATVGLGTPTAMAPGENMIARAGPSALRALRLDADLAKDTLKEYEDAIAALAT